MERKSSIHIKKANVYFILHSVRANKSNSVVFLGEENEYLYDKETALKKFRDELKKREFAYTKRTGKKLPKNTITLMSSIVNLNKNHNLEDVKKIVEHLEKTLDTKVVSVAIHRDEGKLINKETGEEYYSGEDFILNSNDGKLYWVDENKNLKEPVDLEKFEIVKNYHAHIEFLGLDSNGTAIKRNRLTKWYLSNLQTFVAETLCMERGYNYYKNNKKAPKRLDVRPFKKAGVNKRKGKKEKLAKVKDLDKESKKIRELFKELGAKREDYADIEQLKRILKERIKKEKDLTKQELEKIYKQKEAEFRQKLQGLEEENNQLKNKNQGLQAKLDEVNKQLNKANNEISRLNVIIEQLKNEVEELKKRVEKLNTEKSLSKEEKIKILERINEKVIKEGNFLNEKELLEKFYMEVEKMGIDRDFAEKWQYNKLDEYDEVLNEVSKTKTKIKI